MLANVPMLPGLTRGPSVSAEGSVCQRTMPSKSHTHSSFTSTTHQLGPRVRPRNTQKRSHKGALGSQGHGKH